MVQVVWFKRDLRLTDHTPLFEAVQRGPVLPLLIIEPDLWQQPDMAGRHYAFMAECARDLQASLRSLGANLNICVGDATAVLAEIHARTPITALWSHEETGNGWTYGRDQLVGLWCREHGVPWNERRQFGVVRPKNDRNRWARQWEALIGAPAAPTPSTIAMAETNGLETRTTLPEADELGLSADPCPARQVGGTVEAHALLDSFFAGRGRAYHAQMSSPVTAAAACSRLSPHLAWGTVSMRTVARRAYAERAALAEHAPIHRAISLRAADALIARLHWHCHFIQKLEDEPAIEQRAFHPAFDDARPTQDDDPRLVAWANAQTGWPFVDACMRMLIDTGWINFRMRAMLMAIASYHLWLDWRKTGLVLARRFTDYEPGIHWPQVQMQSGTTAINTPRMYNPIKQSRDQDPDGRFIKRWIPELQCVPDAHVHTPWTMPLSLQREIGVLIGEGYPEPVVDHEQAARDARRRLTEVRSTPHFRDHQLRIIAKHGSRNGNGRGSKAFPKQDRPLSKTKTDRQLKLDL